MNTETTLHQDDRVTITTHRAIFQNTTYPINQITSVTTETHASPSTLPIMLVAVGIPAIIYASTDFTRHTTVLIIGILLLIAAALTTRAKAPASHTLTLTTSAGQNTVLTSIDPIYIQTVANAINQAIAKR